MDKVFSNFRGSPGKENIIPFGLGAIRFIQTTSRVKCALSVASWDGNM